MDILDQNISGLLGIENLPEGERKEMLARIGTLIHQAVLTRALSLMSEESKKAFDAFLDTKPEPESMRAFLRSHVQDFDALVEEEVRRFKEETAKVMGSFK